MKKKSTPRSVVFNLRGLLGLLVFLAGVFLALLGFGGAQNTTSQIIDINPDHAGFSAQPQVGIRLPAPVSERRLRRPSQRVDGRTG